MHESERSFTLLRLSRELADLEARVLQCGFSVATCIFAEKNENARKKRKREKNDALNTNSVKLSYQPVIGKSAVARFRLRA